MRRLAALAVLLALAGAGLAATGTPRATFVATGAGDVGVAFDRAETVAGVPGADETAVADAYAAALRRALDRPSGAVLEVSTLLAADAAEVVVRVRGASNATVEASLVDRATFAVRARAAPAEDVQGEARFRFAVTPRDAPGLAVVVAATHPEGHVLQSAAHALDDDAVTRSEARVVLVERLGPRACDGCASIDAALARLEGEHGLAAAGATPPATGYLGPADPVKLAAGVAFGALLAGALFAIGRRSP